MTGKRKRNFDTVWEGYYPLIVSLALLVCAYFVRFNQQTNNVDKIIDASINVASILIGLLGALLGILISVQESAMIKFVFSTVQRDTVYKYIRQAILSGFFTLASAATLYVFIGDKTHVTTWSRVIFYLWLLATLFLLVSSYRIIDILMYMLANKDVSIKRPPGKTMSDEEVNRLKQQSARGKQP